MVLVRFEPLNPLTPDPDFGNLFCVFWQAIGELQFLVSMFPATYSEFACKVFFAGELLRSCIVHDLVFRQGIGGIPRRALLLRQATVKLIWKAWLPFREFHFGKF